MLDMNLLKQFVAHLTNVTGSWLVLMPMEPLTYIGLTTWVPYSE
jgi:hypothetical protein